MCKKNSDVPMMARTMAKNALPISFGFKIAGWLESLIRLDKDLKMPKKLILLYFLVEQLELCMDIKIRVKNLLTN